MNSPADRPGAGETPMKGKSWRHRLRLWSRRRMVELTLTFLFLLFVLVYFSKTMLVTIGPGHLGVMYKRFGGGTMLAEPYPEGFHLVMPWDHLYVYDIRMQETNRELELLTKNGIIVNVTATVRYHPEREMLPLLHQRVGPDYITRIVIPEVDGALRRHIGQSTAEDLYQAAGALLYNLLDEIRVEAVERYVIIDDVLIRKIQLPQAITQAIEAKMVYRHEALSYVYRKDREQEEAERKRIEADGINQYNKVVADSLNPDLLKWRGIQATEELAKSSNAKVIVIGNGDQGLPVILGSQ